MWLKPELFLLTHQVYCLSDSVSLFFHIADDSMIERKKLPDISKRLDGDILTDRSLIPDEEKR